MELDIDEDEKTLEKILENIHDVQKQDKQAYIGHVVYEEKSQFKYILAVSIVKKEVLTNEQNKAWLQRKDVPFVQKWIQYLTQHAEAYRRAAVYNALDKNYMTSGYPSSWWVTQKNTKYIDQKVMKCIRRDWDGDIEITITLSTATCDIYDRMMTNTHNSYQRSFHRALNTVNYLVLKKTLISIIPPIVQFFV